MLATWMSYDDLERLVVSGLTAPVVGHSIIYGMGDNTTTWWDNTLARHIGYRPQDSSEPFRAKIEGGRPPPDMTDRPSSSRAARSCARGLSNDAAARQTHYYTNPTKEAFIMIRRTLLNASAVFALGAASLGASAQTMVLKAADVHPAGLPQRGGR